MSDNATPLRLQRERKTFVAMLEMFCEDNHGTFGSLCDDCTNLLEYADVRLSKCSFKENKPTCAKCPVHCYRPEERKRVVAVMRYSGPRMLKRHPLMALRHLLDGLKPPPARGVKGHSAHH